MKEKRKRIINSIGELSLKSLEIMFLAPILMLNLALALKTCLKSFRKTCFSIALFSIKKIRAFYLGGHYE